MQYAIFDIETRIDKELVKEVYFSGEDLSAEEAYQGMRQRLLEERGGRSDFFPIAFHIPISIAVGQVNQERILVSVETVDEENYSEESIVRSFWQRVEQFRGALVSFNGRNFDLPVLELQALKYGCPAARYFNEKYGHRYRYSEEGHYDLYDFITNAGMYHIRGGFNLLAKLVHLPGKKAIDGSMVQKMWEEGRLNEIHRYCRHDVIQTYFLLLRIELVRGRLEEGQYHQICASTAHFLKEVGP